MPRRAGSSVSANAQNASEAPPVAASKTAPAAPAGPAVPHGLLEEAGLDRERDNIHRLLKIGPDPAPDEIDEGAFTLNGDYIDGILDDARR